MTTWINPNNFLRMNLGVRVDRAAANLPQTAQTPYFTVAGGRVLLTAMLGEVTTIIQAQATTAQLIATPTTGTAVSLSSAATDLTGKEVGSTVTLASTLGGALTANVAGATLIPISGYFVVRTGTIDFKTVASSTGATKWSLFYIPLDSGASVVAA